jgi:hypothetical protein
LIRGFPNGETHLWSQYIEFRCKPDLVLLAFEEVSYTEYIGVMRRTQGTEISQYLEERTSTETPLVVTSERGLGQFFSCDNWNLLESWALAGDSPVQVMQS